MDDDIKKMLQQGVDKAREGDKDGARKIFEQVLEKDDENTTAWLWLYRVVDDINEKRICLTTVLQLDPNNDRAQRLLVQLDARSSRAKAQSEIIPGVTRSQLRLIILVGVVVVIVVCALVFLHTT